MSRWFASGTVSGWVMAGLLVAGSLFAAEEAPVPREVRDLYYGEVLFQFYQDKHFTAITHLLAALEQGRVSQHQNEAELLLGGLYLSYGQHQQAQQLFQQLLDREAPPSVRNRAWYYLAKLLYQRGSIDSSLEVLARIEGPLDIELQGDQQLMTANLHFLKGDDAAAQRALTDWQGPEQDLSFALYNRGIAQIRQGQSSTDLQQLGLAEADSATAWALKDKANLALGFGYLQRGEAGLAKPYLQQIRLQGPFSNKALLGLGWADAELENFESALISWNELAGRNVLDQAVQESLLAVPYALGKLTAYRQAVEAYERAITILNNEKQRLQQSIDTINRAEYLSDLLSADVDRQTQGWLWQLASIDDSPPSHYLSNILAGHEFQEGLKNYRDLLFLDKNLSFWANEISIYDHMLALRRQRYQQRLPSIETLGGRDIATLSRQANRLSATLDEITRNEDFLALMTLPEREQYDRLEAIGEQLQSLPTTEKTQALFDKQRVLKGFLSWQTMQQFSDRRWQSQKKVNALQQAVAQAEQQKESLTMALDQAPGRVKGVDKRIQQLRIQVPRLQQRLSTTVAKQQHYLKKMAIKVLQQHQARIDGQIVQAHYGIATLYDQANHTQNAPPLSPVLEELP